MNIDRTPQWQKSSYCGTNACVEVARDTDKVTVRNSNDKTGPSIIYSNKEWMDVLRAVKNGEPVFTGNPGEPGELRHPNGAAVQFTADEWAAFVKGAKAGEFEPHAA